MANPFLPLWEYIPDAEPRLFGDRVYLYGSHDLPGGLNFCDYKLKVWSASIHDLNHWECHGHSIHTRDDADHKASVPGTDKQFYAPDVVEKDGNYYLYTYIRDSMGCVSVSDKPEGPFTFLSNYQYASEDAGDGGIFNDIGVLVDDDGKVYAYYGFQHSCMNEIDPETMYKVLPGSLKRSVIKDDPDTPTEERFYEASSPRKIGDTYYLIYSPCRSPRLAYATSDSPTGPFTYRGYIIDNGVDFDKPQGNDHGSICKIGDQWYVFYHRMTNGGITSRRACVEKITILPDGTIPPVEMTSLGFEDSLSPYYPVKAEIACVLTKDCFVTEKDLFCRVITDIRDGCVIGYKYFEFGEDFSSKTMKLTMKIKGCGQKGALQVWIDAPDEGRGGRCIGKVETGLGDGEYSARVENVTGRHALYFVAERYTPDDEWMDEFFKGRNICELEEFVFLK